MVQKVQKFGILPNPPLALSCTPHPPSLLKDETCPLFLLDNFSQGEGGAGGKREGKAGRGKRF